MLPTSGESGAYLFILLQSHWNPSNHSRLHSSINPHENSNHNIENECDLVFETTPRVSLAEEDFLQHDGLFNRQPTQITVGQIDDNPVLQNFSVTSGREVEENSSGHRDGDAPWANQQAAASADSDHRVSQHPEIQCSTEPELTLEEGKVHWSPECHRYWAIRARHSLQSMSQSSGSGSSKPFRHIENRIPERPDRKLVRTAAKRLRKITLYGGDGARQTSSVLRSWWKMRNRSCPGHGPSWDRRRSSTCKAVGNV